MSGDLASAFQTAATMLQGISIAIPLSTIPMIAWALFTIGCSLNRNDVQGH
jgi:hypothetical protein